MVRTRSFILFLALALGLEPAWAAWDDPPLVNTVQATTGVVGLNFGMPGRKQQIAMFLVNSNDPAGFHVEFTFANKGYFKSGVRSIPMTNVVVTRVGGIMGLTLDPPNDYSLTVNAVTGIATWSPTGGPPTSATDMLVIGIFVDWPDESGMISGFYQENITAVIVSGP